MHTVRNSIVVTVALVLLIGIGCGGNSGSVPVEGKVTLDSKPLGNASIAFSATTATGPGPFVDTTDEEGKFSLGPVGTEGAGAEAGAYMLVITTVKQVPNATEDTPPPTQKEIVPMKYRDGSTRVEVPEGGKTDFNFDMKSR